jgi:hypothetical protein
MTPIAMQSQVRPRRLRFGLLSLCLFMAVTGAALGWIGRSLLFHPSFVAKCDYAQWRDQNAKRRGALLFSRWREIGGRRELIYLLVVPDGLDRYGLSMSPDFHPGRHGRRKDGMTHIHGFNEGLAQDGVLAPVRDARRIWILTQARSLEPIPLEPGEIKQITLESLADLPKSKLWQEKIGPVWERESNPDCSPGE